MAPKTLNETRQLISRKSVSEFLNDKRSLALFTTSFFLKTYQNPCQGQQHNKEFMQLSWQQQLLTSMHQALKVTTDVLSTILY